MYFNTTFFSLQVSMTAQFRLAQFVLSKMQLSPTHKRGFSDNSEKEKEAR